MKTMKYFAPLFILLAIVSGCSKSSITDQGGIPNAPQTVYIVNEGNYGKGNASITMYLPDSMKAYQDVFANANGRNLGDVGNDMVLFGKYGYIVVNNSQRIEVVLLETMKSVGTINIPGLKSPFKIAIYSDTKGYVTDLYNNSVTVFNPTTYAITKDTIGVGQNPQGIISYNGKIYVCNSGYGADSTISVIDPLNDVVVNTIVVDKSPSEIGVSADGKLIVKCDGVTPYPNPQAESAGSIVKIDPSTQTVTSRLPLPLATYDHPAKMALSSAGFAYVKVKAGIMKMDTKTMTVTNDVLIPYTLSSINGMAYDNGANRLYVADAIDYVSPGTIIVYDAAGKMITTFKAGIIPGTMVFRSSSN
jgi:YVTN family beta-propeller protein